MQVRRLREYYRKEGAVASNPSHDILALCLTSRKNLCIHPVVSEERDGRVVDAKCYAMTSAYRRGEESEPETAGAGTCTFYESFDTHGREMVLPPGVYGIDDLKEYGHRNYWCPYFTARNAIMHANVVIYSYHYLLDPKIAEIVSKVNMPFPTRVSQYTEEQPS